MGDQLKTKFRELLSKPDDVPDVLDGFRDICKSMADDQRYAGDDVNYRKLNSLADSLGRLMKKFCS